jgi:thymidylate kinase
VRDGYLEMAAADPERWVVVDGSRDVDAVAEDVGRTVDALLERRGSG